MQQTAAAIQSLKKHRDDPEVCRQVEAFDRHPRRDLVRRGSLGRIEGAGDFRDALPRSVRGRATRTKITPYAHA